MSLPTPAMTPTVRATPIDMARTAEKKFPVYAPDGHLEMHTRQNVNDLVRHGTMVNGVMTPWSLTDPAAAFARMSAAAAARGLPTAQAQAAAAAAVNDRAPSPRLDALRAELTSLGGAPDPTHGIARLQKEIDARLAASPGQIPTKLVDEDDAA